jgi:hypothetical protein
MRWRSFEPAARRLPSGACTWESCLIKSAPTPHLTVVCSLLQSRQVPGEVQGYGGRPICGGGLPDQQLFASHPGRLPAGPARYDQPRRGAARCLHFSCASLQRSYSCGSFQSIGIMAFQGLTLLVHICVALLSNPYATCPSSSNEAQNRTGSRSVNHKSRMPSTAFMGDKKILTDFGSCQPE